MKKADIILILAIILVAVGLAVFFFMGQDAGEVVKISVNGKEERVLPLDTNTVFTVETVAGYNEIEIKDGLAFMKDADCRDQICVEHKKINRGGETIVCLPHKLVVEIVGESHGGADMVVG